LTKTFIRGDIKVVLLLKGVENGYPSPLLIYRKAAFKLKLKGVPKRPVGFKRILEGD